MVRRPEAVNAPTPEILHRDAPRRALVQSSFIGERDGLTGATSGPHHPRNLNDLEIRT